MTLTLDPHVLGEIVIVGLLVLAELGIRYVRARRRQEFELAKRAVTTARELEGITLEYNRQNQLAGVFRLSAYIVALFLILLVYDIQAFSYFVIGVGAVLVILRESVSSLVAYFYILVVYDVGDDIKIGDALGEIARIAPLYTSVIGKDESGEYNGKLSLVPNYLFLQQKTERQELKTTNYRRASILWTYDREYARLSFPESVQGLRAFLDELLPIRSAEEIGFFRNYAGRRYRLGLDFNADGKPTVRVAFVAHPDDSGALREKIIGFLEEVNRHAGPEPRG
jgi:hypothetical protein